MANIFDELLESYAQLKRRELTFRLDEAQLEPKPDDPVLAFEPDLISQLSQILLNQNQEIGGLVFERQQKPDGTEVCKIVAGEDPRGGKEGRSVHPIGTYENGMFIPNYGKAGKLTTRGGWYKVLNKILKTTDEGKLDPEEEEGEIGLAPEVDSPDIRRAIVSIKDSISKMWNKDLFYRIKGDDSRPLKWLGKTVASPLSYIDSATGLNQKLLTSLSFNKEDMVDPVTGEITSIVTPGISADLKVKEDSLSQLGTSLGVMADYLDPDTSGTITPDKLRTVSQLISIDRKRGIIIKRSSMSDQFLIIPKGEATFWDDILDNYNMALEEASQFEYTIRTLSSRGSDSGNLNDIRGKSLEKILQVISLVKTNKKAAADSLAKLFSEYSIGLFEAFSNLEVFNSGGVLDNDSLKLSILAQDLKEVLGVETIAGDIPGTLASLNRQATFNDVKSLMIPLLVAVKNLHKSTFFASSPDAVAHAGNEIGAGKKADLRQIFVSKEGALKGAKALGLTGETLPIGPLPASEVMTGEELSNAGISADQEVYSLGVGIKTYTKKSETKVGQSSEQATLNNLAETSKFRSTVNKALNISDSSASKTTKFAKEIDRALGVISKIGATNRGSMTVNTITNAVMKQVGHYGLTHSKVLDVVNGTNGRERLDLQSEESISSCVSRLRSYVYSGMVKSKLGTKSGREFLAQQIAMTACAEEELVTSLGFLETKESFNIQHNKTIYSVLEKFIKGEYKAEQSKAGYSFSIKDKSGKTKLTLKSDRKRFSTDGENGDTYKRSVGEFHVMLPHKTMEEQSLTTKQEESKEFGDYLKDLMEAQEMLFSKLYDIKK